MKSGKILFLAITSVIAFTSNLQPTSGQNPAVAVSIKQKLQHVESNGKLAQPDPSPTTFTEQEINTYLASGVELPTGLQSVRFQEQPGIATANTRVDFDRLKAETNSSNPLLSIFTGIHDIVVVAHGHGAGGKGFVQVDSVSLDGVQIPRFVLQLFVDKYLRPKYPQVGLDSQFALPDRIDTAVVGTNKLTITQK